ncbi:hypothetical protein K449DRAFT_389166 [Hypoxylon sp. EC38]|nr:hypothetical protein K449DRAFT_389166 [Hypoxylon sp. EC38]
MRSILVLAITTALAVTQIGYASADLNARQKSLTSTDMPTLTPPPNSTATYVTASTSSSDSITKISAPTVVTSPFANVTATGTATQTLGGVRPSTTLGSSLIQSLSASSSPNAAATSARIGAGVLAGMLGVVAAL